MPHPKTCQQCGKPFLATKKSRMFCSYACSGASKARVRPTLTCAHCGKAFQVKRAYRGDEAAYCSHACYLEAHRITRTCLHCGKTFTAQASSTKMHCSDRCARLGQRDRLNRVCPTCGKQFEIVRSVVARGQGVFCSQRCARDSQIRQRVKFVCEQCGANFEVTPSQLQYRSPRFCSITCARKFSGETLPEAAVRDALSNLGIEFEQEYPCLTYHLDFFLPSHNLDVEVDGDYWHREKGDLDKRRDKALRKHGIVAVRIKECEIMQATDVTALVAGKLKLFGLP